MADSFGWLVPLAPLLGALIAAGMSLAGLRRSGHYAVIGGIAVATLVTFAMLFGTSDGTARLLPGYRWLEVGSFSLDVALRIDPLALTLLPIVTTVGLLVACYSVGYMTHDAGFTRYFAIFGGFVFSMTMLVLANNLLLLYAFWEGVGLCSYLLIGFWFQRPSAASAATKAFLVNRIADAGFLVGILILWQTMHSLLGSTVTTVSLLDFGTLFAQAGHLAREYPGTLTLVGFLLLLGAIGKSAQFPLHVWLPDAMEGPTPVSALIHAATMVTAGVYLLARLMPILVETPIVLTTAAVLGAITALLGAVLALFQTDLKRILAYSTVSQLGYMFMGLGAAAHSHLVGAAVAAAMFHLVTHAFFKALLFLAAGNVMHAMGDVIDLDRFGGLRRILPQTRWLFLIGTLALAGLPPLAGFWSKDSILAVVSDATHGSAGLVFRLVFLVGLLVAFLTPFYSFRAYLATFHGPEVVPPEAGSHPHEAHPTMLGVMSLLAVGSLLAGLALGLPHVVERFLGQTGIYTIEHAGSHGGLMILSAIISLLGLATAWGTLRTLPVRTTDQPLWGQGQQLGQHRLYIDDLYQSWLVKPLRELGRTLAWFDTFVLDGLVQLVTLIPAILGLASRRVQRGVISSYALMMAGGLVALLYLTIR